MKNDCMTLRERWNYMKQDTVGLVGLVVGIILLVWALWAR